MTRAEYERLYRAQLEQLDAQRVVDDLHQLAGGAEPVLLCWERRDQIAAGKTWCHRHMVADWLRDRYALPVEEL